MSGQIKLKLPSGGSKTIAAPDSAATETITLPAGTKTLLANDSTNGFGVDTNGNAGLGVTPESWGGNRKGLQVGLAASLIGHSTAAYSALTNNAYYDTGWKYTNSDEAALVEMETNGTFAFKVAGSGTAGQPITTWTTGFEVLNDGKARAKNGLLFGTDTAAANALDDYEEGTWTPAFSCSGSTIANATAAGWYTKIGNTVQAYFYLRGLLESGTGANALKIDNLPFVSAGQLYREGSFAPTYIQNFTGLTYGTLLVNVSTNSNMGTVNQCNLGTGLANVLGSNLLTSGSGTYLVGTLIYSAS